MSELERPKSVSRRRFLAWAGAGLASAALAGYPFFEPGWLQVESLDVAIADLPRGLDGLRIAQVSDVHFGPYADETDGQRIVAAVAAQKPDLIAITGDFISRRWAAPAIASLTGLRAPLGVFAVLGNHDHWEGARAVADQLGRLGVRLLVNASQPLEGRLWLAGLDDAWSGRPDLDAALRGIPAGAPRVLLAHEPDVADWIGPRRVDLQLSGHTHAGQVWIPGYGPAVLPYLGRKYVRGRYRVGATQLYVNRGYGMIAVPVRFNCRPEITVLRLRAA